MAQRISRAQGDDPGGGRAVRAPAEARARDAALRAVLHVLYLMFNEGYTATSGRRLARAELTTEAIRLVRLLREPRPTTARSRGCWR